MGYRTSDTGALFDASYAGCYWSSLSYSTTHSWSLYFDSTNADQSNYYRRRGFSVRCVRSSMLRPAVVSINKVKINGVIWGERNVDAPGTFAATPESYGMFYQWNRKTAWHATGDVTGWDDTDPSGDVWAAANDPCPVGWRVPTKAEQATLVATDKVTCEWTTLNGVSGCRFTDRASGASIFFPAAGYRDNTAGALRFAGDGGLYWSGSWSDPSNFTSASWSLHFISASARQNCDFRRTGFSVRCVRESPRK